jgi:hypothetical protein
MNGDFKNDIRHFDPCKNKVPQNFFSTSLKTGYYSHQIFNTPETEYGRNTSCKDRTEKWDVLYNCKSKWTKTCSIKNNGHYYNSFIDDKSNCGCYSNPCNNCSLCIPIQDDNNKETTMCSQQLLLKLRNINKTDLSDNVIEFKVLHNSSKEKYLASHFPKSFVRDNRFLCAEINDLDNNNTNIVDNVSQEKFTESNQHALTMINVKKYMSLKLL